MRPERAFRLAEWLRGLAIHERGTARALTNLGHLGNAAPCETRARLFEEIAKWLETAPGGDSTPPELPEPIREENPPSAPAGVASRRKRL